MTKTLIIFLIILSCLVAGGAFVIIALQNNNTSLPVPFVSQPTPTTPPSMISLTLSAEQPTVIKQQSNTIDVILDTSKENDTKPKLIQMEIAYDPDALSDVTITPGEFFVNPLVPLSTFNTHSGRISYALSVNNEEPTPYSTSTIIARLTFIPNPAFHGKETFVSFLGKTMIRGKTNENILTATYGTRLFFASTSANPR